MKPFRITHVVGILASLFAFNLALAKTRPTLKFGVHPLYNPQKIFEIFSPICDQMTAKTQVRCVLEPSKDYAHFNTQIKERHFDVLSPNPFQTIKAEQYGYKVFAKWSNDELFKGVVLVHKDSGISELSQLKGKRISFPASTALAAAMMPQYDLAKLNLLPEKDYSPVYVGSQDTSILAVYNRSVDAGVTWIPPWRILTAKKPELLSQLVVIHQTESLPNNSLIIKKTLEPQIQKEVEEFFLSLKQTEKGRDLLSKIGITSFESASGVTYDPVRAFIEKFEKKVGPAQW